MMERSSGSIAENVRGIEERIAAAAEAADRDPADIRLMAVTKTNPAERINEAIGAGITLMGENRVQEFLSKYDGLHKDAVEIHFIGHLQTNKVKFIIDKVSMIHSVGSLKLAREIDRQAEMHGLVMDYLLEVNIGNEDTKSGVAPAELMALAEECTALSHIRLRGIMSIPPFGLSAMESSKCFADLYKLFIDIRTKKLDNSLINVLSMGMSDDFEQAIGCGSTLVRVGTGIFGSRK